MHLFPQADVPVVQLSLPPMRMRRRSRPGPGPAPLRDAGVLLVGSGSMTHNLRDCHRQSGGRLDYVQPFSRWIEERIAARDTAALLDWLEQALQARRAHPTDDHFCRCSALCRRTGHHGQLPEPRSAVRHAGHGQFCIAGCACR
jgi:4,5-DOPA dioxygenase extradiol